MTEIMQDYYDELGEQMPKIIVVQQRYYYDDRMEKSLDNNNYFLVWEETDNEGESVEMYMHGN